LPFAGHSHTGAHVRAAAGRPLSQIVKPLTLDPLTVADDPAWLASIQQQRNLPPWLKSALAEAFQ
jgi:hypothetical protein